MDSYFQWVKGNFVTGFIYLRYWKIWMTVILGGLMQFLHNAAHNYVYYLASIYGVYGGPDNMLTDLGFEAFRDMPNLSFWPNFCLFLLAALTIVFAISPFFTRKIIRSSSIHPLQILWRAIWVTTFTIILRCTSFFITILPSPAKHCSERNFAPRESTGPMFSYFNTGSGCSDLIFSSHVMYGLIAVVTVHFYTVQDLKTYHPPLYERLLKYAFVVLMWVIVLWEAIAIVRQKTHYSIDVFTALYAVPSTWIVFYHFVPNDPIPPSLRKIADKLEGSGIEADSTQLAA